MQKSGLDILSIDSVLTLRPHWFPAVRAFFMGVKKGSPTWRRGWVIQSKKISWCWSPLESNKINHKTNYKQEYWCQEFSWLFFLFFTKKTKKQKVKSDHFCWLLLLCTVILKLKVNSSNFFLYSDAINSPCSLRDFFLSFSLCFILFWVVTIKAVKFCLMSAFLAVMRLSGNCFLFLEHDTCVYGDEFCHVQ